MHTSVHLSPLACLHTATQHLLYSCEGMKEIKEKGKSWEIHKDISKQGRWLVFSV